MKKIAIALLALFATVAALAQPAPPPRGAALAKYLELTPGQIAAWKQIRSDTAAAVKPLAENARDLRKQLDDAVNAPTPDATTVGKLTLSLHSVRGQIQATRKASEEKLRDVLTADQKVKFDAFQAAARFQRGRRR